jgi:hypothetical protein
LVNKFLFFDDSRGPKRGYLRAVDDLLRHENDNPTIGLILCKKKNGLLAEYALRDMAKPLAVSDYALTCAVPENLKASLPTVEEIERELEQGK